MKSIHALMIKKICPTAKLASAISASLRFLISTQKIGMISNLPYLLKELTASTCEPDVHAILAANSPRIVKIRMTVTDLLLVATVGLATGLCLRKKMKMTPTNNMNFARLKKPIGKLTAVASAQTSNSRKLKIVFSKMIVVVILNL